MTSFYCTVVCIELGAIARGAALVGGKGEKGRTIRLDSTPRFITQPQWDRSRGGAFTFSCWFLNQFRSHVKSESTIVHQSNHTVRWRPWKRSCLRPPQAMRASVRCVTAPLTTQRLLRADTMIFVAFVTCD